MQFDQRVTVPVGVDRAWDFLMNMAAVSACVPGVEAFEPVAPDTYGGTLKVSMGPIVVRLMGTTTVVERDLEARRSVMDVRATEKRINSTVTGRATMTLVAESDEATQLEIVTEVSILGKLGEFGQGLMRRKADQLMAEFAANMVRSITLSQPD